MSFFLVSMFQMHYMPCIESVMLLSVINNQFPSFLQQHWYLILAQYHYNVLNYFAQLVGSTPYPMSSISYGNISHRNTVRLKVYRVARYLWNWTTPQLFHTDHFPIFHGSKGAFKYKVERYCASIFHTVWKLHVSFTHQVLQGTDYLWVLEVLCILPTYIQEPA